MQRLVIRHQPGEAGGGFEVQRVDGRGAKCAPAVQLEDPLSRVLPGSDVRLGGELAWYLESYLDYPFGPNEQRAERVPAALRAWGQRAFEALFGQGQARDFYRDATRDGHTELHLVIASDDAAGARLAVGSAARPAGGRSGPALPHRAPARHRCAIRCRCPKACRASASASCWSRRARTKAMSPTAASRARWSS